MSRESDIHTDEVNALPWTVDRENGSMIRDAKGAMIATFEVRHVERGVMGNCDKNADLAVRAVNFYMKAKLAGLVNE